MDLSLQLTITNGFLSLKDLYRLGRVNKYMNSLFEEIIKKYYNLLQTCSLISFIPIVKQEQDFWDRIHSSTLYNFNNNHLCKKLNKDEMAFYYTYFIFNFHKFYKTDLYSKYWMCILYENGLIKSFSDNYNVHNNLVDTTKTDIILKINIHYSFQLYRNYPKKLFYWGTKIIFENNNGKVLNPEFVNVKLLDKLITSEKFKNMISKNFCKI